MAKKLGNAFRLWIESATPGTYNIIAGQQSLRRPQSAGLIDISDKDNAPYGLSAPGLFNVTVSLDLIPNLPDANGFTRLHTKFKANETAKFQIRDKGAGGVSPADVEWECECYVTQCDLTYGMNEVRRAAITLTLAAAPTVDTLL